MVILIQFDIGEIMNSIKYLYKYRAFDVRSLMTVFNNKFWASNVNNLNDVFESNKIENINKLDNPEMNLGFEEAFRQYINNHQSDDNPKKHSSLKSLDDSIRSQKEYLTENIQQLNNYNNSSIYSLSTKIDSPLLWALYADSGQGFVVEYDFERLKKCLQYKSVFRVSYDDNINERKSNDCLDEYEYIFGVKSLDFEKEDEVRFIFGEEGLIEYSPECVTSIIFGPKTSNDVEELIYQLFKDRDWILFKKARKNKINLILNIEDWSSSK